MANAMAHRGPDDAGIWMDNEIALAHRRLAVVDLSVAGHQPMVSHSGRYVIIFNGEIYNHTEIRGRLEQTTNSIAWRGSSDTESLLTAVEHFGVTKALQLAIGMFAVALWDRRERTLYVARDRLGEKPLYFGWQGRTFMFGSELKALLVHPSFGGDIDRDALALFVRHNYIPTPWSIYRGIRKLAPGSYIELRAGAPWFRAGTIPSLKVYWSLQDAIAVGMQSPFKGDSNDAVDVLHKKLSRAVGRQIVADVPVGAFLSSGVDSTTIVALMQAHSTRPVKTFTIGFSEPQWDEATPARAIAKHLGTDHTQMYVSPHDAMDVIPRLPLIYDEPFSDSSQIPTFIVSKLARRQVTVALSGDGGDELFGGYERYLRTRSLWKLRLAIPDFLKDPCGWAASRAVARWKHPNAFIDKVQRIEMILSAKTPEDLYYRRFSHWSSPTTVVRQASEPATRLSDPRMWPSGTHFESRMMAVDTLTYLPDDVLVKLDRAAMATSLETRVPLLDHRVVEFAWQLPLSFKMRMGEAKWILRQVLNRYVPRDLVEHEKKGFSVPIAAWLRGPLRDWAECLLDETRLKHDGYFNVTPIREKWDEHTSGRREWTGCLWNIVMFQAWLDHHRTGLVGLNR